jgi:hypothetical protein
MILLRPSSRSGSSTPTRCLLWRSTKAYRFATLAVDSETPRLFLEQLKVVERRRETLQAELEILEAEQ